MYKIYLVIKAYTINQIYFNKGYSQMPLVKIMKVQIKSLVAHLYSEDRKD